VYHDAMVLIGKQQFKGCGLVRELIEGEGNE